MKLVRKRFQMHAIKAGAGAWSLFLRLGRLFVEVNFGRGSKAFTDAVRGGR